MLENTPRTFIGSTTFQLTGMACSHCRREVIEEISRIPGVQDVAVDLPTGCVTVTAAQPVDRTDVASAVDQAGYLAAGRPNDVPNPAISPMRPMAAGGEPGCTRHTEHTPEET